MSEATTPGRGLRGRREEGMTLVEMLVVLAVIGVAAGAVTLGIGSADRGNRVESEARQLAARLRLAADDAMVQDRGLAFAHDAKGYSFVVVDDAGRFHAVSSEAFARHDLPGGMTLDAGPVTAPVPIGVDGAGSPVAARIADGRQAWAVGYDGLNVSVVKAGAVS